MTTRLEPKAVGMVRRSMRGWVLALPLALACSGTQEPPPPPAPPGVFLVAPESNVIGTRVALTVNVTGCTTVQQLQILQGTDFVRAVDYQGPNTAVVLPSADFVKYFGALGIAVDLTLSAKVICDDNRTNTSQPVGVQFFPVQSVYEVPGHVVLPDAFVAEGGTATVPVTFVGCARLDSGLGLVRVDAMGQVVSVNATLPFACTAGAVITDLNRATGTRWLFQPGVGAFSFVSVSGQRTPRADLGITSVLQGKYAVLGVGPDGDAIAWEDETFSGPSFRRFDSCVSSGSCANGNIRWETTIGGVVDSTPVVDSATGLVHVAGWFGSAASSTGIIKAMTFDYQTGTLTGGIELTTLDYGALNTPVIPTAVFSSPTPSTLYFPFETGGDHSRSGVMACPTTGLQNGCVPKWKQTALFDDVIRDVVSIAGGSQIAAVASGRTWFLDATDGHVTSAFGAPITASGALVSVAAQVGLGPDFYLLNGPPGMLPIEIVAVDSPTNGELWRYSMEGGGVDASTSLTIAIDDSGQSWLRVGLKQVRPLSLGEYRTARGPTRAPP